MDDLDSNDLGDFAYRKCATFDGRCKIPVNVTDTKMIEVKPGEVLNHVISESKNAKEIAKNALRVSESLQEMKSKMENTKTELEKNKQFVENLVSEVKEREYFENKVEDNSGSSIDEQEQDCKELEVFST